MICSKLQACIEGELQSNPLAKCDNHNKNKCMESSDRRSSIKCEEKKKKYVLENTMKNQVISLKMDGGVIVVDGSVPEKTNKCDYLYVVNGSEKVAILTELKGINVEKSLTQIYGTLNLFKDYFKSFSHIYGRAIVTSSTPNLKAGPEYVKLCKMIRKTFKGNIKIVERQFVEKDTELAAE